MNKWYNKINDYKNPISFSDIYLDKYNKIHNNLLTDALNSFIKDECNKCNSYISYQNSYISNLNNSQSYTYSYLSYINVEEYINSYRWIEKENININYWEPAYIYRISKYPKKINNIPVKFSKDLINLTPYWENKYKIEKKSSYFDNNLILFNDDEPHMYEIDYIDYVKEKIRINDKLSENKIWMKFDQLKLDLQKNSELLKY